MPWLDSSFALSANATVNLYAASQVSVKGNVKDVFSETPLEGFEEDCVILVNLSPQEKAGLGRKVTDTVYRIAFGCPVPIGRGSRVEFWRPPLEMTRRYLRLINTPEDQGGLGYVWEAMAEAVAD